jgi:cytochrome c553
MKHIRISIAALLATLLAAAGPACASDPNLGRNLAATCANCHGTNGKSVGINVVLAGMPKDTLLKSFKDFKSGEKPATLMHQLSKGYTETQADAIATYFAAQK